MDELLTTILTDLSIISEQSENEAFSAISLNPLVTWTKFILTDDKPNGNKQRIPIEEFDNLIKTGIFMPIKMTKADLNADHPTSVPVGVITHLKKSENKIYGLGALWSKERPEDIALIKQSYADKKPVQLSWEIQYGKKDLVDDVEDLRECSLRATVIVGMPAYQGRTPIIEVASLKEENKLDEKEIKELTDKLATSEQAVVTKDKELETLKTEVDTLRAFKAEVEKKEADTKKLVNIKEKFASLKIEKPVEYFETNKEKFLALSEEALDFMLQEMVAFRPPESTASQTVTPQIPNIPNPDPGKKPTPQELAKYLRDKNIKK